MMKLSVMSEIVFACSRQSGSSLADEIVSLWFCDHEPLEFVRISANCVFKFEANGNAFFLRFNSDHERRAEQLNAEIDFVNYLANKGIHVAKPVPSLNGSYIRSMGSSIGLLHASVFNALPGRNRDITELTPQMLTAWGYALGNFHHTSRGYTDNQSRHSWHEHLKLIETYLPRKEHTAWRQLEQVKRKLNSLPTDDDGFGLIHYDFELDNIVWDGEIPGIIDFDDCAQYWYVADIAFALRDLFEDRADRVDFHSETYRLFIQGYKTARDISLDDLQLIPVFMRMHNLTVFAKLLRTLEDAKSPEEPEWMDGLRVKLLNKLRSYREAFAVYPDVE